MNRRLILLTRGSRFALVLGIASGVLIGLCSLAQAYVLSSIIADVFLGGQDLAEVWPWMLALFTIIAFRAFLVWLQEYASRDVAVRVKQQLRKHLFAHLMRLGPGFTRGEHSGELIATAVEGVEQLDAYYSQYLPQLAISILVPATILGFVFPRDVLSGTVLLLTAPLIPFFAYMIGKTAETAASRQYATLGRLSSQFLDSLQGLTTLKIFGQAAAQVKNIARAAEQHRVATLKVLQTSFLSAFALELLATIGTAIIAVEVGLRLLYGDLAFQRALFILILAPEFYLPLRALGAKFHAGIAGRVAARRIFAILDTSPAAGASWSPRTDAASPDTGTSPAVELRSVSFTYPNRTHPALENVDLAIGRGERVALVGPSGAGKSTLVNLMLGFLSPTDGEILLQGRAQTATADRPRDRLITWVPQEPYLFHDTIATNMRLGKPDATNAELWQAARLAHLDDFIETLPDGLASVVGEGGALLSSGEAQRLALARAVLVDAPILILDEPSSSLDPENEANIEESIQGLSAGRTVITIAHRLHTVRHADRILVFDQGRIVEQGTHEALLAQNGVYARIVLAGWAEAAAPWPQKYEWSDLAERASGAGTIPPPRSWWDVDIGSTVTTSIQPRAVLSQLLSFLAGSWGSIALAVLLGSLTIGSSIALMGTSAWLISTAALHPSIGTLQVAIVGVRFFGIARAVLRYLERLVSHSVTLRVLGRIRVWFYSRLEPLAPARLLDRRSGDLVAQAISDVETLENLYVRVLAPPITALCVAAGTSLTLVLSGAYSAAMVFAGFFVAAGLILPLCARWLAERPGRRAVTERASLHVQLVDAIQGLADLMAFGCAEDQAANLAATGSAYAATQRSMAKLSGLLSALSSVIMHLTLWVSLVLIIPMVNADQIPGIHLAPLALIILASFEVVQPLPLAGQLWPATREAAARLLNTVQAPSPPGVVKLSHLRAYTESGPVADSQASAAAAPRLTLAGVRFCYPDRPRPALQDVSWLVEPGETVGIVGPSGAGKSTIAHLLLRFWDPDAGDILLNNESIRALAPEEVRARIGYASQRSYFFDTSVYENLRLARRGTTREEVEKAAHRAGIHETILALPQGYDTIIGEHGLQLSAGERRRLAIVRLMLKDAPLLVLDEPTANLDAENERAILSALFDLLREKTGVLITHRLLGMEQLHQIVVIDHGRIVERGRHGSLLRAGGLYSRLWDLQHREAGLLATVA